MNTKGSIIRNRNPINLNDNGQDDDAEDTNNHNEVFKLPPDPSFIFPHEYDAHPEFLNPSHPRKVASKTPQRYLHIRNTILEFWNKDSSK
jgi:hypothetical protein